MNETDSRDVLKHYSDKRLLITGGAGCIGSNLAKALLSDEPEIIVIIDYLSASQEWKEGLF